MDGSIRERKIKNGSKKVYDVTYRIIDPVSGKKIQKLKRGFLKKGLAQDFLVDITNQIKSNTYVDLNKTTTREFLTSWISQFVEGRLAENTIRGYKININKHLIPSIGSIPLQQLSTRHIQDFYDEKLRCEYDEANDSVEKRLGLSAKSIIYIHRNLCKALDYAVKERLILRNPAKDVELPTPKRFEGKVYDHKTLMKLLDIVKNTEMELPVALAGLSGLRRGECAGILWDDIELENKIINVRKQRSSGGKGYKRSNLKTIESNRSIQISNTLFEIIERHKEIQKFHKELLVSDFKELGFLCCEADGGVVSASCYSKRFFKILSDNKLPPIRFHDLRHSFATNMIRLGVPINAVSKMLGHSSPVVTMSVYAHCMIEMQGEAMNKLDADILKYTEVENEDSKINEAVEVYLAS